MPSAQVRRIHPYPATDEMNPAWNQVFEVVKANALKVLVDVRPEDIQPDTALSDLGANSIDRVEVVMYSVQDLGLRIPPSELQGVGNLRALVDVLLRHKPAA